MNKSAIVPEWLVTRVHVEKLLEDEKELTPTMVSLVCQADLACLYQVCIYIVYIQYVCMYMYMYIPRKQIHYHLVASGIYFSSKDHSMR